MTEPTDKLRQAEAERDVWRSAHDVQKKHAWQAIARAEKAEAERDEARSRFNDIDLCRMGQAPCEAMLAAERTAYAAGWIAGRDAAAEIAESRDNGWDDDADFMARGIAKDIRALTPPEPAP